MSLRRPRSRPLPVPRRRKSDSKPAVAAAERLEDRTLLTAYVVDTLSDDTLADGKVSLREAVQAANANAPVGDAVAGQAGVTDTITFAAALTSAAPATITLGGNRLDVTGDLSITGPGA